MSVQVFNHPSKKVLVTGVSGTGKTTLFEKLIRKEKARWKFIFDHQGEFQARFGHKAAADVEKLCAQTAAGGYVIFDPVQLANEPGADGERRGLPGAFAFFCDFVFAMSERMKGRKLICCDELQKLVTVTKSPDELLCILDTGRRYQLDFFGISQAPNLIHNAIRNQITEIYAFRQADKNAVQFLIDNGFNENEIRNLERFAFLWRNLATGEDNFGGGAAAQSDDKGSASGGDAGGRAKSEDDGGAAGDKRTDGALSPGKPPAENGG